MEKGKKKSGLVIGLIVFGVLALGSIGIIAISDDSKTTETVSAKLEEKKAEPPKQEAPKEEVQYEIIKLEDSSSPAVKKGAVRLLVNDDANKESIEKAMKQAAQEELKKNGYEMIWVWAYGDKRFSEAGNGYTHGMLKLDKSGTFSEEKYNPKKEIPNEKEKEIYLEWFKYIDEKHRLGEDEDQDKLEEETNQYIMKKYNLSEKEFEDIFMKVSMYVAM